LNRRGPSWYGPPACRTVRGVTGQCVQAGFDNVGHLGLAGDHLAIDRGPGDHTEFVAAKLGISVEELMDYFRAPNRSYRDYRSQDSVYAVGARAMRLLGLELGGKR
jgi:hypothetical protein